MSRYFIDDVRSAPNGYICIRPTEIETFLSTLFASSPNEIEEISFDHDLGLDPNGAEYPSGYEILKRIEEEVVTNGFIPPRLVVHSANPVGRTNMLRVITSIYRRSNK